MNPQRHPRVLVVSGPSGAGKSTIIRDALERIPQLRLSVSCTTRAMRPGEVEGRDYRFVDVPTFETKIAAGDFLEWARVYDNFYGTERAHVASLLEQGYHAMLDVDVQGAMNIKTNSSGAVFIFIKPPSLEELEIRLRDRGTESEESLGKRMAKAEHEQSYAGEYDHVIMNDYADRATKEVVGVIRMEEIRPVAFQPGAGPVAGSGGATPGERVVEELAGRVRGSMRDEMIALINNRVNTVLQRDMDRLILDAFRKYTGRDS